MGLFDKAKVLFKVSSTPPDLLSYIGRTVVIPAKLTTNPDYIITEPEQKVKIEKIVGNIWKPNYYEINGKHLIGMLRFHAQMNNDKSITEEQFLAFEDMELNARKLSEEEQKNEASGKDHEQPKGPEAEPGTG